MESLTYRVVCLTEAENRIEPYEWIGDEHEDYAEAYDEYIRYGGEKDERIVIEERKGYCEE